MAVAAMCGVRAGKETAEQMLREERSKAAMEIKMRKRQKQKMADSIMSSYDANGSGGIDRFEMSPLLEQCSLEVYGKEVHPSADDIDFLFRLCCESSTGEIQRAEVLKVVDAWNEFVKSKAHVKQIMRAHDADGSGSVDYGELLSLLNAIKDQDQLRVIQPEVAQWIFSKADLNGNPVLTTMELARALCAYDLWLGKRVQCMYAPDTMLIGLGGSEKLPAPTRLSEAEWKHYMSRRAQVLQTLERHDLNGDSVFQFHEVSALMVMLGLNDEDIGRLYRDMDLNGDSVVSVDEFLTWLYNAGPESNQVLNAMAPTKGSSSCAIS